jgi:heat shock protein HslJ
MNRYHALLIISISLILGGVSFYVYSEVTKESSKDVFKILPIEDNQNTFIEQTTPAISITKINKLENKKFSWVRTELTGSANMVSKSPASFILSFDKDLKFTTSTDCNTNSGIYQISGATLSFSNIVATRMFCENSQEDIYIEQLSNVDSFEINGDNLYLILNDKKGRMVFSSKGL